MNREEYICSKYNLVYNIGENQNIIFNTLTQGMMLFEDIYVQKMLNPSTLCDHEFNLMKKYGFIVKENYEDMLLKANYQRERFNYKVIGITIELTNSCNFLCKYCYQPHEKRYLSRSGADEILKWIENKLKEGVKIVKIHWFGGEPLLNIEIAFYMQKQIEKLLDIYSFKYFSAITTNGYLIDECYEKWLKDMNINRYEITLDGIELMHDYSRPLLSGNGTFKKILENIHLLINSKEEVSIRYNVNKLNTDIRSFISLLKGEELLDKTYLYFQQTTKFQNSSEIDNYYFSSLEEYALALSNIYNVLYENKLPIPRYSSYGVNCKFDCINHFLINTDLELVRCSSTESNESSMIGKIVNGLIDENINVTNEKIAYDPFIKEKCINCKVLPFCKGGCYLLQKTGRNECIPEKYILEDYVKLLYREAIRDVSSNER
ncbi:uncharacterized protein EDD65_10822 [Keratinibaculum paraultunense]|uniref:Radical SAM core domain-containing protein n=1 Tax=Keratinibaculum paraultunense TaxID=1278232 RepID=A0A4R3KU41_9FIRM|nr:radical SAM protein [Keratinibaculum paraultunense]QQY79108.1 radical SAM protein [Keratinibaculum paraultunense]TCS88490.1 uncharacterized protein EDD65_10822 [Keratinibaculum paraultunense]